MSEVQNLENQLELSKALVERRRLAIRLSENRDFKKLILDEFCGSDAARYVQESADPSLTLEQRADALNMAQASGHLKRYLSVTIQMGAHAERTMPDLEETLVDARQDEEASE